jgi:hypothetical protein
MNYLAHGHRFLDRPYFVAGTALPDWMNVVNRRHRVRAKQARTFVDASDPRHAEFARGILQHHHDDDWFHRTPVFAELSLRFAKQLRDLLAGDAGQRPGFVGHIVVEILLDAVLAENQPEVLDQYYLSLARVEPPVVAGAVSAMTGLDAANLALFIPRFLQARFLYDYADDAKLLFRMNQVMGRVGLARLPDSLLRDWLPSVRHCVRLRHEELFLPSH